MGGRAILIFILLALWTTSAAKAENDSFTMIRGAVIDEFENLVPAADTKLECGSLPPMLGRTDRFGSFSYEHVPEAQCKVYAAYRGMVGVQGLNVSLGAANEVVVVLHRAPVQEEEQMRPIGMALLGALGVLVVALALAAPWKKKHSVSASLELDDHAQQVRTTDAQVLAADAQVLAYIVDGAQRSRFRDVFQTLGEKEQRVVTYLKENKDFVSQNKISRAVAVPKTSLRRVIESLERKNLIEAQRLGKFRKIRLTAWFLEGE